MNPADLARMKITASWGGRRRGADVCLVKSVFNMAGVGFRWLDILEKEFDKAFVDLDITIGKSIPAIKQVIHILSIQ